MNPVNIYCPCNGDAYKPIFEYYADPADCNFCIRAGEKCLGVHGWPLLAYTAAEVARERDTGGTVTNVTLYPGGIDPRVIQDDWGWIE